MKKFTTFETQLDESVVLTDKAKLSLYKKSQNSGISVDILEEVYRRGYRCWNEDFGGTQDSFAFDRVNSFIADGFAAQLDEDLKKACWKGYEAIGMKKKNGKTVPNCVPVKEDELSVPMPPVEKLAKKNIKKTVKEEEARSKDPKKPCSRFIGSDELVTIYKSQTPGQIIKKVVKEAIEIVDAIDELEENWQDKKYKNPSGGLTKAGVNAYRREHPGSNLKTAVTTEPSKLKPGSKSANRRKSFCARMGGMKKRLTSTETARDPDSRINKALRKWHCEETEVNEIMVPKGTTGKKANWNPPMVAIRVASGKIEKHPPGKSGSSGGGGDEE
jgi:hypothetical protein